MDGGIVRQYVIYLWWNILINSQTDDEWLYAKPQKYIDAWCFADDFLKFVCMNIVIFALNFTGNLQAQW